MVGRVARAFVFRLYVVEGTSMEPSIKAGDCLLVSRKGYRGGTPARGDVAVIVDPVKRERNQLKRIVGMPGEDVRLYEGTLLIDGEHYPEPYLAGLPSSVGLGDSLWRLGDDQYFVMGDNRAHSTDSRQFGPITTELIGGKAWFRCWPLGRWGRVG